MKKLLILLLVFVTLIPSCASAIDIRKEGTVHQGGNAYAFSNACICRL